VNKSEDQFPQGMPTLVDSLNSGKEPAPTTTGIPSIKEIFGSK